MDAQRGRACADADAAGERKAAAETDSEAADTAAEEDGKATGKGGGGGGGQLSEVFGKLELMTR